MAKQITSCTIRSHMPRPLDSFKLYICKERTASPRGLQIREGAKNANSYKRHVKPAYEPMGKHVATLLRFFYPGCQKDSAERSSDR